MAGANKDFFVRNGLQVNTQIVTGNSTVNCFSNSTGLKFSNSTVSVSLNLASVATSAQIVANNSTGGYVTVDQYWGAAAYVGLVDAATVALDLSTGLNFTVTLGGNRTLGFPTNPKVGQSGYIEIVQDGTGGRTLSFGAGYKFDTGTAPSIDTTIAHKTVLYYTVRTTGIVLISMPFLGVQ